jgi:hypothetical protein
MTASLKESAGIVPVLISALTKQTFTVQTHCNATGLGAHRLGLYGVLAAGVSRHSPSSTAAEEIPIKVHPVQTPSSPVDLNEYQPKAPPLNPSPSSNGSEPHCKKPVRDSV